MSVLVFPNVQAEIAAREVALKLTELKSTCPDAQIGKTLDCHSDSDFSSIDARNGVLKIILMYVEYV